MAKTQILVVEDENIVALDIKNRLENLGYTVPARASSGEEAIRKAAELRPDLVLMDIKLKGKMDGVATAEQIRVRFDIPVIYLTAYTDEATLQRAKFTEPYGYLLKPFEEKELHTTIEMALYRHKMERQLKESEQWLATTLKSISDAVIATDTHSCITFMNPVAEAMTGWKQTEALGQAATKVFNVIDRKTHAVIENPITNVLRENDYANLVNDILLIARNGTQRPIDNRIAPIRDEADNIIGTVLVFRDVTIQRKMEFELLRMQKLESLGVLAGGIAHDFNNMLTVIAGNISLIKMAAQREDSIYQRLEMIEQATFKAKELAQQLLTFSKGGTPVKKRASITKIITESADFTLKTSNVRCRFVIPDDLWPVEVDQGQIGQALNNVFINAEQAMPLGGTIRVQVENIMVEPVHNLPLESGEYVKISVQDRGIGIAENHLAKVFDPYFTTKSNGNGLGLATAYSIINKHNGHITVESKRGLGATFHIYLPASKKEIPAPKDTPKPGYRSMTGKRKLLFMDDKDMIRITTGQALEQIGYTVELAADGAEAIGLYKNARDSGEPFDAVILDLTVPGGMGGKETIKQLLDIDPQVKAIVSSGYYQDPVMSDFREYGFSAVVAKPYKIEDMNQALCQILEELPQA